MPIWLTALYDLFVLNFVFPSRQVMQGIYLDYAWNKPGTCMDENHA